MHAGRFGGLWRQDAVSPVIGTIMMVAVTVTLATVLYIIVGPLINPEEEPPESVVLLKQGRCTQVDATHFDTVFNILAVRTSQRFDVSSLSYAIQASTGSVLTDATFAFSDTDSDGYITEGDAVQVIGMLDTYKAGTFKLFHKGVMIGQASIAMW